MDSRLLKQVVRFTKDIDYIIMVTTSRDGVPHITTAGELKYDENKNLIKIAEWFCSTTVANLNANKHIGIVVWKPEIDRGYQLQGSLMEVRNTAVLDGYTKKESQTQFPQTRKELLIKVEKITEFSHTVHSDENLMDLQEKAGI
jgi:general stress protein 26